MENIELSFTSEALSCISEKAIQRLERALSELIIDGISTTSEIFTLIIKNKNFIDGSYDISWLENLLDKQKK